MNSCFDEELIYLLVQKIDFESVVYSFLLFCPL